MLKLYGIPNCNTVKKARTFLEENNISYEFVDFKKHPADESLLDNWLQQVSWEQLINKKGTTYRALTPEIKESLTTSEIAKSIMMSNNSIIKRPVIVDNNNIIKSIGFDETVFKEVFHQ